MLPFLQPDEAWLKHSFVPSPFFRYPFLDTCAVSFFTKDRALIRSHARAFPQESDSTPQLVGGWMDGCISEQGSCTSSPDRLPPLSSFPTWPQQKDLSLPAHTARLSWHGVSAGKLVVAMLQDLIQQYPPRVLRTGSLISFWEKEPRRPFRLQSCCKLKSRENSLLVSWRIKSMVYQKARNSRSEEGWSGHAAVRASEGSGDFSCSATHHSTAAVLGTNNVMWNKDIGTSPCHRDVRMDTLRIVWHSKHSDSRMALHWH